MMNRAKTSAPETPSHIAVPTDRREYPRVGTELQAEVVCESGDVLSGRVLNLSRAGLLLSCDRHSTLRVLPGGNMPVGTRVQLVIRFTLHDEGGQTEIVESRCRVASSRRSAENEFHLGVQYLSFAGEGYSSVSRFVAGIRAANSTSQPCQG